MDCDKNLCARSGIAGDVLKQFAERFAERENLAQIVSAEVRSGDGGIGTFAADLDHPHDLVAGENGSADQLLDEFRAFAPDFHALENGGVADAGKIIDDVRTAFARRTRGDSRSAGKGDKTDLFEGYRDEKVEVAPARGDSHQGDFVGPNAEIFGDALSDAGQGDLGRGDGVRFEGICDAFQL